jgi:hypothetical protein
MDRAGKNRAHDDKKERPNEKANAHFMILSKGVADFRDDEAPEHQGDDKEAEKQEPIEHRAMKPCRRIGPKIIDGREHFFSLSGEPRLSRGPRRRISP